MESQQIINVYRGVRSSELFEDESTLREEHTSTGTKLVSKDTGEEVVLDQNASKSAVTEN